jgi:peptidoglycan/xylan/chitin deacetylase (PgdA/CDA1 family)
MRSHRETRWSEELWRSVRLPVLTYHHVGTATAGSWPLLTIAPAAFEKQIRWLIRRGYTGIRSRDWLCFVRDNKPLPKKPVLLTFDDAYADLAETAFPTLQRYRFPATVFAVTDHIGEANTWDVANGYPERRIMSAANIREWFAQGMEFGAHTRSHPDLCRIPDCSLVDELEGSKAALESLLGSPVEAFAYPYGSYDERVVGFARKTFDVAFTCDPGMNRKETDIFRMCRVNAGARYSWFGQLTRTEFGLTPAELGIRAQERARRLRI